MRAFLSGPNRSLKTGLLVLLLALPLTAASCGANDAPVKTRDRTGARVYNMPDHFSSVASKCDGLGHRIYESDHGNDGSGRPGGLAVINDPRCNRVGP